MIAPGDLVWSRRMSNHCTAGYEFVDGIAKLVGDFDTFTGPALVIAVIDPEHSDHHGVLALLLPRSQRIVFTRTNSVWEGP